MAIRSDEIGEILKQRIASFEAPVVDANEGVITSVSDGIARIYGLEHAMAGELLEMPGPGGTGTVLALALDLREDGVGAVILGPYEHLQEGDAVRTTGRIAEVPVGDELVGRVVNALGEQLDDRGPDRDRAVIPTERVAPGVIERENVDTPMQTGLKAIDSMIPIGRGQRELIIGDRQTGKTAIAIDAIINQKGTGVICIYVAIGQNAQKVAQIKATLETHGAHGAHHHRRRDRVRPGAAAVPRTVRRLRDGRVLHAEGRPRADHLRRSQQARRRVSRAVAAAPASTVSRGLPG